VADDFTFQHENNFFCDIDRKVSQSLARLITIDRPSTTTGNSMTSRFCSGFPLLSTFGGAGGIVYVYLSGDKLPESSASWRRFVRS
jgi:hypothetical protein